MKKIKVKRVFLISIAFIVLALIGIYILLQRQTYSQMNTITYYEHISEDNPGYVMYLNGVIKYTRDGVSFLDKKGEEVWNHPCQMNNPLVDIRKETIAICDRGGTSVLVFEKEGLKGELQTTRPIERISVSEQGIVSVILKDDVAPMVMCYDAAGNILVEQNASLDNTGYPMDVAISEDGSILMVSYLCARGDGITTRIVFYDFGGEDVDKTNYQIFEKEYAGVVAPLVSYLDKDTAMMVADDSVVLYEGKDEPAEAVQFSVDTICNLTYDENQLLLIIKNEETSEYKLQMFNMAGEQILELPLERDYSNVKLCKNQILLYENNVCSIYTKDGICKYEGETDLNILEIFPLTGLNKYMMINANGFYEVRLAN